MTDEDKKRRNYSQDARGDEGQSDVQRALQTRQETRAYYNKLSRFYDLLADIQEGPMRENGLKMLAATRGEAVLEIGFGTGHALVEIAKSVGGEGRVLGVDLSDQMIRRSGERLEQEGPLNSADLIWGDAEHLPLKANSIDAIFMCFALDLFDTPDIPKVLGECKRVLRPGGRMVGVSTSKEGHEGLITKAYEWTHHHFPNLLDCRPIFLRRSLEEAGFGIKEATLEHSWVSVEIVLAEKPRAFSEG